METTNLGRVGFVNKGDYVDGTHKLNDVVKYDNEVYACISPHFSTAFESTKWQVWTENKALNVYSNRVVKYINTDTNTITINPCINDVTKENVAVEINGIGIAPSDINSVASDVGLNTTTFVFNNELVSGDVVIVEAVNKADVLDSYSAADIDTKLNAINDGSPFIVETINDLKDVSIAKKYVEVLGSTTKEDGQGGLYWWDCTPYLDVPDNKAIVESNTVTQASGVWRKVFRSVVRLHEEVTVPYSGFNTFTLTVPMFSVSTGDVSVVVDGFSIAPKDVYVPGVSTVQIAPQQKDSEVTISYNNVV